jgi:PiT family inorganic phosphate transporter
MADSFGFVVFLILVALVFDFLNGFHDSANAISTIVSTRVLSPRNAVLWAAFFEFSAFFFMGVHVANTVGTGIIDPNIVDNLLILAALGGAIVWNIITWYFGLPSSSSHALIGGLIGAGLLKAGSEILVWDGISKTTIFIVLSPAIGMGLGLLMMILVLNLSQPLSPDQTNCSENFSLSHARSTAWDMAPMTPRRPWESLPLFFTPRGTSVQPFMFHSG